MYKNMTPWPNARTGIPVSLSLEVFHMNPTKQNLLRRHDYFTISLLNNSLQASMQEGF